jgi:hypothetical protein
LGRSRRGSRHLELTTTSAYLASCNSTARESAAADAALCPHVWPPPHHDHDQDAHNAPRGILSARSPSPGATFASLGAQAAVGQETALLALGDDGRASVNPDLFVMSNELDSQVGGGELSTARRVVG